MGLNYKENFYLYMYHWKEYKILAVFDDLLKLLQAWSVKNNKGNNQSAAKLEKGIIQNWTHPQPTILTHLFIIHFK